MIAALALLLVCIPASWGNDLYALPKATAVTIVMLAAFWRKRPNLWCPDMRPWAYFAATLAISTFFSWDLGYSLLSIDHSRGLGVFEWAICALLYLYGCNERDGEVDRGVLYGGGIMAVYAAAQALISRAGRASVVSTQGGPVVLGEMLVVCFPTAYRLNRALAALFLTVAFLVRCRSAVLAMAVMTAYLFWKERKTQC